jgi:two-component system chemotaxis sensor kinase CheA
MSLHNTDDDDFLRDALPAFISESVELLDQLEQLLLELEASPGDRELLDALFRCAHTIKGSAGLFGLDDIVQFTHHVETFLDALRTGQVALNTHTSQLLLRSADQVRRLIAHMGAHDVAASKDLPDEREALIDALHTALSGDDTGTHAAALSASPSRPPMTELDTHAAPLQAPTSGHHLNLHFKPDTFRDGFDPLAILDYLGTLGEIGQLTIDCSRLPRFAELDPESCHLDVTLDLISPRSTQDIVAAFDLVREDCDVRVTPLGAGADEGTHGADAAVASAQRAPTPTQAPAPTPERRAGNERRANEDARFLKVRADRLDEVINLLGELVIAGAGTALLSQRTGDSELIESSHQLGRLIEEIRNGTLQLRMVQIGETFGRFRRVVHDLAAELGKDVHLDIQGADTELDKSVVERMTDPLMHLVRNALDHGLETREQRLAAGKPESGTLRIAASHDAGGILISISDDGRGIDRERVLARARERGLVAPGVTPNDADLLALIFEPGFSTAEHVTNLSGRGVGMDVVRRNIESLRGRIDLHSEQGHGTTIDVRLPLTLAIIDGFLVGVGPSKFIFPLEAVVEVIESRPTESDLNAQGCSVVELRGQVLPVLSLRRLYGIESPEPDRSSVVVIQSGGRRYGVLVDQLLGQHQTVIKPLSRMFRSLRGMSGSSILGNGEVALIVEVTSLSQLAEHPPAQPAHLPATGTTSTNALI